MIVEYPSFAAAAMMCGEGHVVVGFRDGEGKTHYGVGPSHVEIPGCGGEGVIRQPLGEFMAKWWDAVADEAARRKAEM